MIILKYRLKKFTTRLAEWSIVYQMKQRLLSVKPWTILRLCPDGFQIPPCSLNVEDCGQCEEARSNVGDKPVLSTQLSNLRPGEYGAVAYIGRGGYSGKRLHDMGLTPGTRLQIVNAAPFNGPIEVRVRETNLALGRALADQVFIHVNAEGRPWKRAHSHGPHHNTNNR